VKSSHISEEIKKFTLDVRRSDNNVEEQRKNHLHFYMRVCLTKAC